MASRERNAAKSELKRESIRRMIQDGARDSEIAKRLGISYNAVKRIAAQERAAKSNATR